MSKKKSRSIIGLPSKIEDNVFQKYPGNKGSEGNIQEEIGTPLQSHSTITSDLEGILDLSIRISGPSSGSSLGWSEEYESEVSKKVHLELEKLDRIFQGLDEDVSPYDENEIAEWKHYFPHLYILGHNTPTNSAKNSDASSDSDNEMAQEISTQDVVIARNRGLVAENRTGSTSQDIFNPIRGYNSLPRKPRSLEIGQYLKISSIKSPDTRKRKQNTHSTFSKQTSKEWLHDISLEYASLPFITVAPVKTQSRKRNDRNKPSKLLILPPIENSFRSVSATPRQASSKSMYEPLNYERNFSKRNSQARSLKSDLMKLFDHIPISNR